MSFPLTQSKSGPDPKLLKRLTIRIQSKCQRNRYILLDLDQYKPSQMLISERQSVRSAGTRCFAKITRFTNKFTWSEKNH